jgi:chaperonin GroEL
MEEGIVPGGGMALFNVKFEAPAGDAEISKAVASIITRALEAPVTAIAMNSGESAAKIISELRKNKEKGGNGWTGFNAITNSMGDLKEAGIIDPLKVTKIAFTNAISVASNYLMMGAAATDIPEKNQSAGGMGGGMDGMGY